MRVGIGGRPRRGRSGLVLPVLIAALGCASTLDGDRADAASSARDATATSAPPDALALTAADAPAAPYDAWDLDACPGGRPPPLRRYRCDAFAPRACANGYTCRPFIDPPTVPCGAETYRTECFVNGPVPAGGPCRLGTDCAAGTGCFTTAAGNRCLALCRLNGATPLCPRGAVCEPTDLPDFGVCL